MYDARKGTKSYVYKWIRSLFKKGQKPLFAVVHEAKTMEELNYAETLLIKELTELGFRLVNSAPGGEGLGPLSVETCRKISEAGKLKWAEPGFREKVSAGMRRAWKDPQIRQGLEQGLRAGHNTAAAKANHSRASLAISAESRAQIAISNKKNWLAKSRPFTDSNGREWILVSDAAKFYSVRPPNLRHVLAGKRNQTGGVRFWYTENPKAIKTRRDNTGIARPTDLCYDKKTK